VPDLPRALPRPALPGPRRAAGGSGTVPVPGSGAGRTSCRQAPVNPRGVSADETHDALSARGVLPPPPMSPASPRQGGLPKAPLGAPPRPRSLRAGRGFLAWPPGRAAGLLRLGLLLLSVWNAVGCNTYTDKRVLQYLNVQGFGKRYTGNAEEENYISLGDTLQMTDSFHPEELAASGRVEIDGTVLLPELGAVQVAGMTRTELEAFLMEKYSAYYDLLDIKIRIVAPRKSYFLFGEVTGEGQRQFEGDLTVWEAVMLNNPNLRAANLGRVRLIRPDPVDPLIITIDIAQMIETGDSTYNIHVQELDIIYVPPTILAQLGYFVEALIYPFTTVLSAISGALWGFGGGFNRMGGGRGRGGISPVGFGLF
jgi:protein involved in polysaccharide export with SLBB domain